MRSVHVMSNNKHTVHRQQFADINFVYRCCEGTAWAATEEYRHRFLNNLHPRRVVISNTYYQLPDMGPLITGTGQCGIM
jgi:hypothetical protein